MPPITDKPSLLAGHVGRETTASAFGQTWKFSRWTRRVWMEFAEWAKTILPSPIDEATKGIDKLTLKDAEILRELRRKDMEEMATVQRANEEEAALAKAQGRQPILKQPILMADGYKEMSSVVVDSAIEKAGCYLSFNSKELGSLIRSVPGVAYLFYLLLMLNHPGITEDDAFDISQAIGQDEVTRIMATVSGRDSGAPKNGASPAASSSEKLPGQSPLTGGPSTEASSTITASGPEK